MEQHGTTWNNGRLWTTCITDITALYAKAHSAICDRHCQNKGVWGRKSPNGSGVEPRYSCSEDEVPHKLTSFRKYFIRFQWQIAWSATAMNSAFFLLLFTLYNMHVWIHVTISYHMKVRQREAVAEIQPSHNSNYLAVKSRVNNDKMCKGKPQLHYLVPYLWLTFEIARQ